MELASSYLAKYARLEPPQASTKKLLVQVIRDECGITLTERSVSLSRGGAILSCHPTERSELARCVPQILTLLQHEHNVRLSFIR